KDVEIEGCFARALDRAILRHFELELIDRVAKVFAHDCCAHLIARLGRHLARNADPFADKFCRHLLLGILSAQQAAPQDADGQTSCQHESKTSSHERSSSSGVPAIAA